MKRQKRIPIRGELRTVERALREIWDPIGLGQMPDLPSDEYDSYAPRVLSLIENNASDGEVAKYLAEAESRAMGLSARPLIFLERVAMQLRAAATAGATRAT